MFPTPAIDNPTNRGRSVLLSSAALLTLSCATFPAGGQQAVDPRVSFSANSGQINQTGRLFDVNPSVGGGGWNYTRPVSPLVGGNQYAAGLMGRGLSLRSVSPISSPTAFRGHLGSSSLYNFRRDSVSVSSAPLGVGSFSQPYYDASSTVVTSGFLQGYSSPAAASRTGVVSPLDMRLRTGPEFQRGLQSQITGMTSGPQRLPTPSPSPTFTSSIFGLVPATSADSYRPHQARPDQARRSDTPLEILERGMSRERLAGLPRDQQSSTPQTTGLLATPLDEVLRTDLHPRVGLVTSEATSAEVRTTPGLIVPPRPAGDTTAAAVTTPRVADPSVLPGYEVFTDMRLALALQADPQAPWFREMADAIEDHPELQRELDRQVAEDAGKFLDQMLTTPMETLAGGGESALNDLMLKAEELMDLGRYSEAADRYEEAVLAAPGNPLPLIGKGHALLAVGDYRTAAQSLVRGLERYPEIAMFPLNLSAMMGGGEQIDIRRADLMKRLQQRENPELRFLLGYLEYHAGDRAHGLQNLRRAARDPLAPSLIARYPDLLTGTATPPKPADSEPDARGEPPAETLIVPPPAARGEAAADDRD